MPATGEDTKSLMNVWKKTNEQQLFNEMEDEYGFSPVIVRRSSPSRENRFAGNILHLFL